MVKENIVVYGLLPVVCGLFWGGLFGLIFDDPHAGLIIGALGWTGTLFVLAFFRGAYHEKGG